MKKTMSLFGGVCLLAILSAGCSSITVLRIAELKQVEARIDSVNAVCTAKLDASMQEQKSQTELLRLVRADMQLRFEEAIQKVVALENSISENKVKLNVIEKKTQDVQEQLKAKAVADTQPAAKNHEQIDKLYQIAYGDFMAGRFDLAANGFIDILNRFADSPDADASAYFYAECFYARHDLDKSEQYYAEYLRKFRDGKHVCSALFKLGCVYEAKKQPEKKKMVWKKLIDTCPDAPEAATAKDRLTKSL